MDDSLHAMPVLIAPVEAEPGAPVVAHNGHLLRQRELVNPGGQVAVMVNKPVGVIGLLA